MARTLWVECQNPSWRGDQSLRATDYFRRHRKPPIGHWRGISQAVRPSVFGQNLDPETMMRAADAAHSGRSGRTLGSKLFPYTPRRFLSALAARRGAPYVVVNRGTNHDHR